MERELFHGVSAEGSQAPAAQPAIKPRVLVVDDDRSMCEFLEIGLRKRGFDIVWRTSPWQGFTFCPMVAWRQSSWTSTCRA